jgi:hypothetical protein
MSNRSNINLIGNSTTAQNLGSGAGIFKGKNNANNLQFKSISATGTSIQIFNCNNQIYISGSTGGGGGTGTTYVRVDAANNIYSCNTSLLNLTIGVSNINLGYQALSCNTEGCDNIALGYQALSCNTTGLGNFASGKQALICNTTGSYNIGIGEWSLFCNTMGNENIALGYYSLRLNTTGTNNIVLGSQASQSNNGSNNIVFGSSALYSNTSGDYNIVMGTCAGYNETGSNKLYIGQNNIPLIYGEFDNERLKINGSLEVVNGSQNYLYLGDKDTDGSWRFVVSGSSLVVQTRTASVWGGNKIIAP